MRLGAVGTSTIMFSGPGKGQLGPARDTWGMRAADVGSAICDAPLSSCRGGRRPGDGNEDAKPGAAQCLLSGDSRWSHTAAHGHLSRDVPHCSPALREA